MLSQLWILCRVTNFHLSSSLKLRKCTKYRQHYIIMLLLLLSCASSMGCHNWSAMQQHYHLQSAACTRHQPALSTDRNPRCKTSFVALHRHTGQSRPVAISSSRHRNDPAQFGSDSGETIVVEGGQNLVVGFWDQPLSGSRPLRPNSSLSSTDLWCLLNKNLATVDSWMTVAVVVGKWYHCELASCHEQLLSPPAWLRRHSFSRDVVQC